MENISEPSTDASISTGKTQEVMKHTGVHT